MSKKRNSNYIDINKDELYDLYVNQQKTVKEIAEHYYCTHPTILDRMKQYEIPRRIASKIKGKKNKKQMTRRKP